MMEKKGYVIYTDRGYADKFGVVDEILDEAYIYETKEQAEKEVDSICEYYEDYDIEEIGVVELWQGREARFPILRHRFDKEKSFK